MHTWDEWDVYICMKVKECKEACVCCYCVKGYDKDKIYIWDACDMSIYGYTSNLGMMNEYAWMICIMLRYVHGLYVLCICEKYTYGYRTCNVRFVHMKGNDNVCVIMYTHERT